VLPFDLQCAKLAAESQHALRRTGNLIGPMDALIAATALAHRATLVTHNVGEFRRVRGLHVEDWL
jgi:tRNA(fMet)-specific endonuclease VapC